MTSTHAPQHPEQTALDTAALVQLDAGARALAVSLEHARAAEPEARELIAALETAHEELSVAGEEVRTQQETICRLVASHTCLRMQQERTLGILPVPAFVTDMNGLITSVNAAAMATLQSRITQLLGKPLVSLFSQDDRHEVRTLISACRTGKDQGRVVRRAVTLLERRGGPAQVELTGSVQLMPAARGEIAWFLLSATDTGAPPGLSESLARLAMLAHRDSDLHAVLAKGAAACAAVLDAHVTIALGSPAAPRAVASSSLEAQTWDGAQVAAGDGPSMHSYAAGVTVVSASLHDDDRWRALRAHLSAEVGAAIATPITLFDEVTGTLTAYAAPDNALDENTILILAQTLSGVLQELQLLEDLARLKADMDRALSSRAVIEQAKGVIMASRRIEPEAAWQHLVRLSSVQERKVRDVAAEIVAGTHVDG
jgi:PAS domain S-box-containing protein